MLEKSYFCSIANNFSYVPVVGSTVVICLKNRTFAVSQTTTYSLGGQFARCDLLEKSYFCSIANNSFNLTNILFEVVICLKNRTFAVSQTTPETFGHGRTPLWFAWKIVLLQYRKQPKIWRKVTVICCDLLEKSYFCSIANNSKLVDKYHFALWFAWKIVLLQYRKQLTNIGLRGCIRCDLLEKSYFCSIANNDTPIVRVWDKVVICLKNRTFAVSQTTFKEPALKASSCDLLEKSYFCSIANNNERI